MSQHYSDPSRESEPTVLPDVETFEMAYAYCNNCGSLMQDEDAAGDVHCECGHTRRPTATGWFYWFCMPGCLPDSEPMGPFATEQGAMDDVQEDSE